MVVALVIVERKGIIKSIIHAKIVIVHLHNWLAQLWGNYLRYSSCHRQMFAGGSTHDSVKNASLSPNALL